MSAKPMGLLIRLADAYAAAPADQPVPDSAHDIALEELRADFPGLPDSYYEQLAKELAPEAMAAARDLAGGVMSSLLRDEQADALKMILFRIWESPKPRLATGCLLLAVGIKPLGIQSERDLARSQAVSPEHVSQQVEQWQIALRLPKTNFQKSAQAVEAARLHNQRHRRTQAA